MFEMNGKYSSAKIWIDDVEESCIGQITNFLNHPAFTNPIAIMSDCHAGKGSCVGFTMLMTDKIIPNVVSVDIGCGMTSINIERVGINHKEVDEIIREIIPFGTSVHHKNSYRLNDFPWKEVNEIARQFFMNYATLFKTKVMFPVYDPDWVIDKCNQIGMDFGRFINSVGSLGGGKLIASRP